MAIPNETKILLTLNYPDHGKMWCCKEYGLTEAQVRQVASRMGLTLNKESEFWKDFQNRAANTKIGRKRPDQSLVMKRLWSEGKVTATERKARIDKRCVMCGAHFQVSPTNASRMKVESCSVECARKRSSGQWTRRPHPKGMLGKHHGPAMRESMSKRMTGKKPSSESIIKGMKTREANGYVNKNPHGSWKSGSASDLGETHFRSSWERNYARYLNFLIKKGEIARWEFEKETFWFEGIKRGCVSYKPDFKVYNLNGTHEFHEVKGWMDDKSKTKIRRMKKYFPKIKLVVVDSASYKAIAKFGRMFSEHWE